MVPASLLDRLLASDARMTPVVEGDRRAAIRFRQDTSAVVYPFARGRICRGLEVRLKELSSADVRIEVPDTHVFLGDWALAVGPDPAETQADSAVILCATSRVIQVRTGISEISARFMALLTPGQRLRWGRLVDSYSWIACARCTPEDPILADLQAA